MSARTVYGDSTHRMMYYDGTADHILVLSAVPVGGGTWQGLAVVDGETLPAITYQTGPCGYSWHVGIAVTDAPEWTAAYVKDDPFAVADWIMHRMADRAILWADGVR